MPPALRKADFKEDVHAQKSIRILPRARRAGILFHGAGTRPRLPNFRTQTSSAGMRCGRAQARSNFIPTNCSFAEDILRRVAELAARDFRDPGAKSGKR